MSDNVIFPKIEDVNKLVNSARSLVDTENSIDILSIYASNCSKQIHDFCIENAIQKKKNTIDFLSSLPAPIEMGLIDEPPDLKPNQFFDENKNCSALVQKLVLKTSYPIISIAKNWSQSFFLAGSLNHSFYFPIESFSSEQLDPNANSDQNENEDSITDLQSNQFSTILSPPSNHMSFCRSVCFHPSNALCGISRENSVYLYDISLNTENEVGDVDLFQKQKVSLVSSLMNIHQSCVTGLVFSPDGSHFVTSSLDCTIKTYDLIRSEAIYNINIKKKITYLDSSIDGRFVGLTTDSGNLILFDDRQEGSTTNIPAHKHWASTLSFSDNSQLIVTAGSDKSIAVFDIRQPLSTIFRLFKHTGTPISTCFDNSDHVWSSTTAGELQAWNLSDAKNVFSVNLGGLDDDEDSQSRAIYKILYVESNNSLMYSIGHGELRLMTLNEEIFTPNQQSEFNFI